MNQAAYAAVDWGTSSFRLWLVDGAGRALAERRSDEGMMAAARSGFAAVLHAHLAALSAPPDLPVIICGMAGARQGWVEAGYVDTPAPLAAIPAGAVIVPEKSRDVRILPGIAQRDRDAPDVMRGEETQLLGALGHRGPRTGQIHRRGHQHRGRRRALRSWPARSQRHAARTSSMAAGKGCSGARRYSGNSTRIALARPSRAASSPSLRSDPSS